MRTNVTLGLVTAAWMLATNAFATDYTVDQAHTNINFKVKHLLSKVTGRFTDFTGTFKFDPNMKETGDFKANIKTASINTDNADRDKHLRSPDFFNVEKFPEITFTGTKIKKTAKNKFDVMGEMTIIGQTKPVTLKMEYLGETKDPWGNTKIGLAGTTKVNRKDFGLTWNKALETGGVLVGDDVEIELLIEAAPVEKRAEK